MDYADARWGCVMWLPKSCEQRDGRLCCSQPSTALPTISSQAQRAHLSPLQLSTLRKSHTTQGIGWVGSKQSWEVYATAGKFWRFLNFFLHKAASSVAWRGIGNRHFIYGFSGTLQSSATLFCAWRCWEVITASISPSQVLLCWHTQSEHERSITTTQPQEHHHPLLQP